MRISYSYIAVLLLLLSPFSHGVSERGIVRQGVNTVTDGQGQSLIEYQKSYALLIGVSDYTRGWPNLDSIPSELDELERVLKANHDFEVIRVDSPTSSEVANSLKSFFDNYGYKKNNRLLIFFAGHGFSLEGAGGEKRGYLVPSDAPDPYDNEQEFLRVAVDMTDIQSWAKKIRANHALFMFDSCFAGTIFTSRGIGKPPKHISAKMAKPVRQFITAGSANEEVPAQSTFTPALVSALEYGVDGYSEDGYLTGTELGLYLEDMVSTHNGLNAQYGKIKGSFRLAEGDFVFAMRTKPQEAVVKQRPRTISTSKPIPPQPQPKVINVNTNNLVSPQPQYQPPVVEQMTLTVDPIPNNATVKVLNIKPRYFPGMYLEAGNYHIQVSAPGYATKRQWIALTSSQTLPVALNRKREEPKPEPYVEYEPEPVVKKEGGGFSNTMSKFGSNLMPDVSFKKDGDGIISFSIQDAMSSDLAKEKLGNRVRFYFGKQRHRTVARNFGDSRSNNKTNALNKSDVEACQRAFLSAMIALKKTAVKKGGNAVVNIRSNYKNKTTSSENSFRCGSGTIVAGVALVGTVVKLK